MVRELAEQVGSGKPLPAKSLAALTSSGLPKLRVAWAYVAAGGTAVMQQTIKSFVKVDGTKVKSFCSLACDLNSQESRLRAVGSYLCLFNRELAGTPYTLI